MDGLGRQFQTVVKEGSAWDKVLGKSDKFFTTIDRKAEKFQHYLNRSTEQYLNNLQRQELKMQNRLAKKNAVLARNLFGDVIGRYDSLKRVMLNPPENLQISYNGHLDSLTTAMHFLQSNTASTSVKEKLQAAAGNYSALQNKFNRTDFIQLEIAKREDYLKASLENLPLAKELTKYREKAYYYRAQIDEYRNILNDPKKMENTLLAIAGKFPAFQKFLARYSQLGRLFRLPGLVEDNTVGINGLQTRSMIMEEMQPQLGAASSAQQHMSASIGSAQSGLQGLKDRISQSGSSGDISMPNFKPNNQKTKSFLKRIELGTSIQSIKSNFFFPATTDIGFSIGYRLSAKAVAGLGASYKMGWGKDFRHIDITHQGAGLRTFADIKIKGSYWVSGGGELNYYSVFKDFAQLKNASGWQKSALAGLTKKYKVNDKVKGSLQLLYDFLHNRQRPAGQPFVFRMGYSLK